MKKKILMIVGTCTVIIGAIIGCVQYQKETEAGQRYQEAEGWYNNIIDKYVNWIIEEEEKSSIEQSLAIFENASSREKLSEEEYYEIKALYESIEQHEIDSNLALDTMEEELLTELIESYVSRVGAEDSDDEWGLILSNYKFDSYNGEIDIESLDRLEQIVLLSNGSTTEQLNTYREYRENNKYLLAYNIVCEIVEKNYAYLIAQNAEVAEVEIVGTELTKEELGEELSLSGEGLERAYEDYISLLSLKGNGTTVAGITPHQALEAVKADIGLYVTAEEGVEYDWSGSSSASSSGSAGGNNSSSGTASQPSQSTNAGEQGYPSTYSYESQLDYVPETDAELAAENGWNVGDIENIEYVHDEGTLIAE